MNAKAKEMSEEELKEWNQMWSDLLENIKEVLEER